MRPPSASDTSSPTSWGGSHSAAGTASASATLGCCSISLVAFYPAMRLLGVEAEVGSGGLPKAGDECAVVLDDVFVVEGESDQHEGDEQGDHRDPQRALEQAPPPRSRCRGHVGRSHAQFMIPSDSTRLCGDETPGSGPRFVHLASYFGV